MYPAENCFLVFSEYLTGFFNVIDHNCLLLKILIENTILSIKFPDNFIQN